MAESDKGKALSSKEKEKMSELDDDISKSFLGSWDAILGSDDGSMDFKFEPVTKGKKKIFNFDKLDMDFSLDGDFDKIKSFKVDMGDLDFSSPPKTSTKSKETNLDFSSPPKEGTKFKERLEGESAKSNRGKEDCFAFSFDFNELDKFDLDAVLPTRTKGKDDGKRVAEINCADKHKHPNSEILLADTDARGAGALKANSMLVKTNNSKENLVPCKGSILDSFPEKDPSKSSTIENQMGSKQSNTFSGRENIDEKSQVEKRTCNESYEEPQLQNRSAPTVQDQTQPELALINSAGVITDHPQRTDCKHSNEKPKVHNQSAQSFMDKISTPDVSEQMETTSAGNKSGDADSKMQTLSAKVDPPLTLENVNLPVKEMMPQYGSIHAKSLPEAESESNDAEEKVPKNCNILELGMDRATVAENVPNVKESSADLSKVGVHVAKPISGRQNARIEVASSNVSRFTLMPTVKDKTSAPTKGLPTRLNLISLSRNAISSLHQSPSGARHGASARSRSNFDKNSASLTEETIVSENNIKIVSDQSVRKHCNAMGTQMTDNLGLLSVLNDGKEADRGTISERKKEETKSSSFQVQSSLLPAWASKSGNQGSEKLKPKIPSLQSVRKLKMDTIVEKLSTLKVSQKLPNFSCLRISSSPVLEDETVTAKKLDNNEMNVTAKTVQLVGSGKQHSPAPSLKRKITEDSDAAPIMLHPSKRVSANQSRNSKEDLEGVAQEEVGFHKNTLDCSLKGDSYKQPESTLEIPHEMRFSGVGVIPVMENENTIEKAEACGKELDQLCSVLRKKQEEAKELLVRVLVTNNKILLLSDPMHSQKLCQVQNRISRLIFRELPSKIVVPALQ